MTEYRQPPEMLSAARRRELVMRMVRRVMYAAGDSNPPLELVAVLAEKASKLWRWIPDDRLEQMVDRARLQHGGPGLTLERVAEAWVSRHRKVVVSEEERERRRKLAGERAEREKAPREFLDEFWRELNEKLGG